MSSLLEEYKIEPRKEKEVIEKFQSNELKLPLDAFGSLDPSRTRCAVPYQIL